MGQAATGVPRSAVTAEWPKGKLPPNSTREIKIGIHGRLNWVRIKFEFEAKCIWVAGAGKNPGTNEFVREFSDSDSTRDIVIELGIRTPDKDCLEPITLFVFDRKGHQIGESTTHLDIVRPPELPALIDAPLKLLRWIFYVEPSKRSGVHILNVTARVAAVAVFLAGYHYYNTPDPISHLEMDVGLEPAHVQAKLDPQEKDPNQEFMSDAEAQIRKAWSLPASWKIVRGFGENPFDGMLQLSGPGVATFPAPPGALYEFEILMTIALPVGGSSAWIVRAQPDSRGDSRRGYQFTLTNRDQILYLGAKVVGAGLFRNKSYDLGGGETPIALASACCSAKDRIQIRLTVAQFEFRHQFVLENLDQTSPDSNPVSVNSRDPRGSFRCGGFQIVGTSANGPAYEFIRLLNAS